MSNKNWLEQKIGEAIKLKVAEQDGYCSTAYTLLKIEATREHREKLHSIGWSGLLQVMEGESYPPDDEDWIQWLHIQREEIPLTISLMKIADPILRGQTQYLQGVTDQATRQKAIATYFGAVGGYAPDIAEVFTCWSQRTAVEMMLNQYLSSGMTRDHGAEILRATIMAMDFLGGKTVERLLDAPVSSITGYPVLPSTATTSLRTSV